MTARDRLIGKLSDTMDPTNAVEFVDTALAELAAQYRALVREWRKMRTASDETFDWCDYDMEIEASKKTFEQCAQTLERTLEAMKKGRRKVGGFREKPVT